MSVICPFQTLNKMLRSSITKLQANHSLPHSMVNSVGFSKDENVAMQSNQQPQQLPNIIDPNKSETTKPNESMSSYKKE